MKPPRSLRGKVSAELVRRGYRRFDRMHLLSVASDWHFWVDTGPLGNRTDISPWVGIRYDPLERLVAELLSLEHDATVGSVGANVGYILGTGYRCWEASASLDEILAAIDAAFERLRPHLSPDRLGELWQMTATQDPIWRYRDIVLLVLRCLAAPAKAKLVAARPSFCRYNDEMAAQFNVFEERVLALLKTMEPG